MSVSIASSGFFAVERSPVDDKSSPVIHCERNSSTALVVDEVAQILIQNLPAAAVKDLSLPRVQQTLAPLAQRVSYLAISPKPKTTGCHESVAYRYNPETRSVGVSACHEVKTLIYSNPRNPKELHVFVTPANYEVEESVKQGGKFEKFDASELGLIPYTINPINVLGSLLSKNREDAEGFGVVFHVNREIHAQKFVTNNLGSRVISVSAKTAEYMQTVSEMFSEFKRANPDKTAVWQEGVGEFFENKTEKPFHRHTDLAMQGDYHRYPRA